MGKKFINLVESGNYIQANDSLTELMEEKMANFLKEKQKSIIAKTWSKTILESTDDEAKTKASKRKDFRNKLVSKGK